MFEHSESRGQNITNLLLLSPIPGELIKYRRLLKSGPLGRVFQAAFVAQVDTAWLTLTVRMETGLFWCNHQSLLSNWLSSNRRFT